MSQPLDPVPGAAVQLQGTYRWVLLGVAWLVAANLRTTHIGVSPVLPLVQADLGLSYAAAGLLMVVPVAMMTLFAVPGGWIVDRIGAKRTLLLGLVLVSAGSLLRVTAAGSLAMFAYTFLFGVGIGLAQPALPGLVKDWFPDRAGMATGIYTNGLHGGVFFASLLTGGWLLQTLGSWRGTFGFWGGFSVAVTLLWWLVGRDRPLTAPRRPRGNPLAAWSDPVAWRAVTFFSINIMLYFVFTAWLPSMYHDLGWSVGSAARPLTIMNVSSIVASLTAASLAHWIGSRRTFSIIGTAVMVAGAVGFMVSPTWLPWLWPILTGLGLSGPFTVALALPVDLAREGEIGSMAGFMLTLGYLGAAVGPYAVGYLRDLLGSFGGGMLLVVVLSIVLLLSALVLPEGRRAAA